MRKTLALRAIGWLMFSLTGLGALALRAEPQETSPQAVVSSIPLPQVSQVPPVSQGPQTAPQQATVSAKERWENMPESERAKIRENFKHWKSLPIESRLAIQKNYDRIRAMTPDGRRELIARFNRYRVLPFDQQVQVRKNILAWQKRTPHERELGLKRLRQKHYENKTHVNKVPMTPH